MLEEVSFPLIRAYNRLLCGPQRCFQRERDSRRSSPVDDLTDDEITALSCFQVAWNNAQVGKYRET